MVGPISEDERSAFNRRVKYGVTALVGASAGLITSQADATLVEIGAVVAAGLAVGYALAWFVVPSGPAPANRQRRRERGRENPLADGGSGDGGSDDGADTGVRQSDSGSKGTGDGR